MNLHTPKTIECRMCGQTQPAYDRSAWCEPCTERMLEQQLRDMESFRQERQIVERPDLRVVRDDV